MGIIMEYGTGKDAQRIAELEAEIKEKQYAINLALELVRQMDSTKFDSITAKQYEKLQCHLEMSTG